ncbi:MAG TPA: hypothetical protein VMV31_05685 [Terriglobales bacterium]|nr:hypothetical protein [Terriglobales bacterium]
MESDQPQAKPKCERLWTLPWPPPAIALGVLMHFAIAFAWTAVFFLLSRRLPFLLARPRLAGPLFGAVVYLFMTFVAVPLSRVPRLTAAISLANRINAVLALLLCIGLPIALLTRRWLPN